MIVNSSFCLTFLLSLFQVTSAIDVYGKSTTAIGASVVLKDTAQFQTGFAAKFYDYGISNTASFTNDNWVAGGYSSLEVRTSVSSITAPNFSFNLVVFPPDLYGLTSVRMQNVLIELDGFLKRKYLKLQKLIHCL